MGMDLFSVRKNGDDSEYYRFNWTGWTVLCDFLESIGCDLHEFSGTNDGEIVSASSCTSIADKIEELKQEFINLITCKEKDLSLHLNDSLIIEDFDYKKDIITRRLKGEKLTPAILEYDNDRKWDNWSTLQYFLGFGNFCRKCAKLGGFKQC